MEESIYYNRLINMLFNTCSEVLRALLPVLIQGEEKYKSMSVNEFVKSNEEDIMKKKIGVMYTQKLFPTRNRKTNIQNWDITLLCFIAYDILQPDWKVKANIDMLRNIRNELCHVSDTNIKRGKYERHLKIIQDINDVFLGLVNDGNLTKKIADKTEDITNGSPDIDEAIDVLSDWLEIEKKLLKEKCTFTPDKKKILDYLRTLFQSRGEPPIPDTRLVLNFKNCIKEQEISTCREFVDFVKTLCGQDPELRQQTDRFCQIIEEAFQKFLDEGQIVVNAGLGCVIITIKSMTFASLERLWTKCVNGEVTKAFNKLQSFLRETYQNEVEIEVMLPEDEFWEAINKIVKDLQIELPEGSTLELPEHEDVLGIPEEALEEQENFEVITAQETGVDLPKLSVVTDIADDILTQPKRSCLEGKVIDVKQSEDDDGTNIEMVLRPRSWKQLEHMKKFSSSGKLGDTFKKMAEKLQEIMNVKNLLINATFSVLETKEKMLSSSFEKISLSSPDEVWKKALDQSRVDLVANMNADDVLDYCIQYGVIPAVKCRDIQALKATSDKNRMVLEEILRRGLKGYTKFKECLRESSQGYLAVKLEEKERIIMSEKEERFSSSFEKVSLSSPESVFLTSSTDSIYFKKEDYEVSGSTDSFYVPRKVLSSSESAESFYKPGTGAGFEREYSTESSDSWVDLHPDALRAQNGMQISLLKHNISDSEANGDVLVISSSKKLVLRTGTSGKAVLKAAGEKLQQELKEKYPKGIQYGDIAEGREMGKLGFRTIYVTALPDWKGDSKDLRSVTSMCLEMAANSKWHSVVFSALGCGGSNYPKDEAARALFQAVLEFDHEHSHRPIKDVAFLLYPKDTACIQAFEDELRERQKTQMKQNEGKAAVDQFRMKWESESKDGKPVTIKEGKPFLRDAFKYILEVDASSRLRVIIDEGQGTSSKGPDVKKFFKRIFDKSLRHESDMFSGLDRGMCCVPTDSREAGSQKWFFALGKAIVLSQVHGGPKFQHLAEYVVQYVCGGDYEKHLNLVLVSDMDLVKLIHKMGRCTTQVDFKVCFKEVQEDYLQKSNWTEDILIEHCEKMTSHLLKWYLVDKRKEALEQLKKGLNTLSFLDYMRPTPRALDILRHQRCGKVTAKKFRESIEKSLKAMKVESETHETARLSMFKFMDQMTDEDASMFAQFISGAEGQPVLRSHFDIQFNTADISQTAPLAEPAKHKLIIPLGNKTEKEFFSSIRKAILTPPETPE